MFLNQLKFNSNIGKYTLGIVFFQKKILSGNISKEFFLSENDQVGKIFFKAHMHLSISQNNKTECK